MSFERTIVAGGREFSDWSMLSATLDGIHDIKTVVSGTARGADRLGEQYATLHQIPIKQFPADWDLHGRAAGYRRNAQMAEYATGLVAFWDGKSRGTKHMIDLATKAGLEIRVVRYG